MILPTLQSNVVSWLKAAAGLALVVDAVLTDDGTYPKTPGREEALRAIGCCVTVLLPESIGLVAHTPAGLMTHSLGLSIVIETRPEPVDDTAWVASPIALMTLVEAVWRAVLGQPLSASLPRSNLVPANPPFDNWGKIGGEVRVVLHFACQDTIGRA